MVNFLKKIIESLYWKYCAPVLVPEKEAVDLVLLSDDELEAEIMKIFEPKFSSEEEQALYERRFFTLH